MMMIGRDEPCFAIGIVARMVGLHAQTLRYYERAGLVEPSRSKGKIRLYSPRDVERLGQIRRLTEELGLNLAGVEVMLRMTDRIAQMEEEMEEMRAQLERSSKRKLAQSRERATAMRRAM